MRNRLAARSISGAIAQMRWTRARTSARPHHHLSTLDRSSRIRKARVIVDVDDHPREPTGP
jgi:hypothetical protein